MLPPPGSPPIFETVSEYDGSPVAVIACTQFDDNSRNRYTRTQAVRIVSEWCEFFSSGPTQIENLRFVSRTPERLFMSLAAQTQLTSLAIKWGDYEDLSVLRDMCHLRRLHLRGGTSVRTLAPLAALPEVSDLALEGLKRVKDLSPLAAMKRLLKLELGGGGFSDWRAHVASIAFLRELPQLESLWMHTLIVDDLDYTPILDLPNLTMLRVMEARGMRPSHAELARLVPAFAP